MTLTRVIEPSICAINTFEVHYFTAPLAKRMAGKRAVEEKNQKAIFAAVLHNNQVKIDRGVTK